MLHFFFCQNYITNTNSDIDLPVRKILDEYSNRENLKGIGKIAAFTRGIYVLKLKKPYVEVILEEKKIDTGNEFVTVYFVRGFKNGLQDYVEIRDGKWSIYNELNNDEIDIFKLGLL
jgi:hypothetical protein